MSMGTAPCHGYVLEATKENLNKFGWNETRLCQYAKDHGAGEGDYETLEDALNFLAMEQKTLVLVCDDNKVVADVIRYDSENGDRYDDLEDGYYLSFGEEDLYEKKLTFLGTELERNKVLPQEKQWTNFG